MKISYNWLKTIIDTHLSATEAADLLTSSGLEVEGIETVESIAGGLQGIVVGEILSKEKHPDADRLSLTTVNVGQSEPLSIVCGAPNVEAGQKVIIALVGAKLYPIEGEPFEIKKSKIRGALSEGMICAEDEIGLGKSHAGIMVLPHDAIVGTPAATYFKLESDTVLEIGLTPNRSDAASHLGVARDLAAIINGRNLTNEQQITVQGLNPLSEPTGLNTVTIHVHNTEACPRYSGLVITGITVTESPDWLKNRLKAIGVRPINNIVDITNYVLHDIGQPLHAFDLDKVKGNEIHIKTVEEGTTFITLDGVERKLKAYDLMICNAIEPMCIAGVFGGKESGVSETTKAIFIESAYFNPDYIRRTAKHHSLKTDSSFRFERGTDPESTINGLLRATNLILELAGGTISMNVNDHYPVNLPPYKVAFSYSNCQALIGKDINRTAIKHIILALGIHIENEGGDGFLLHVPRFKTDVTREVDVIEEVMRIYGFNNIEVSKSISYSSFYEERNVTREVEEKIAQTLVNNGFCEMMGLSLTKDSYYENTESLVKMLNPLSNDLNVMRGDLLFGALETLNYNINRKNADLKLFELGKVYGNANGAAFPYYEEKHLSLVISGQVYNENHVGKTDKTDFYYLKAVIEMVLQKLGITNYKTEEAVNSQLQYGLQYAQGKKKLVQFGEVSKAVLKRFDISQAVFYADFNFANLVEIVSKNQVTFKEPSKFPNVRRDLALLLDRTIKYQDLVDLAFSTERKLLKDVNLFDVYEGDKLGNKKSYALSFTLLNEEATLTDKQIDGVMQKLIETYKQKLGAELRT
jgi:phenylalanyl-tRNA synthetase beta chain